MKIFYLCNGKKRCTNPSCLLSEDYCHHTTDKKFAKNGSIKSPIDFIRRFKLVGLKPLYFVEKEGRKIDV